MAALSLPAPLLLLDSLSIYRSGGKQIRLVIGGRWSWSGENSSDAGNPDAPANETRPRRPARATVVHRRTAPSTSPRNPFDPDKTSFSLLLLPPLPFSRFVFSLSLFCFAGDRSSSDEDSHCQTSLANDEDLQSPRSPTQPTPPRTNPASPSSPLFFLPPPLFSRSLFLLLFCCCSQVTETSNSTVATRSEAPAVTNLRAVLANRPAAVEDSSWSDGKRQSEPTISSERRAAEQLAVD